MSEELLEPIFRKIRVRRVKEYLNGDCVVCDIGCGNGSFLKSVSQYISKGYGFDKKVCEANYKNIVLRKIYVNNEIPLDSDSVDCVTLIAVLEHLDKPDSILSECYRILKINGKIIITTPAPVSKSILEFLSFRLKIVSPEEIKDHKHYYYPAELNNMLKDNGFLNIKVKGFEFGLNNIAVGYKS